MACAPGCSPTTVINAIPNMVYNCRHLHSRDFTMLFGSDVESPDRLSDAYVVFPAIHTVNIENTRIVARANGILWERIEAPYKLFLKGR